jgi:hypothetical protein
LKEILETERLFGLGTLNDFFENPKEFYGEEWIDGMDFLKWTIPVFDANVTYSVFNRAYDTMGAADWEKTFRRSWNPLRYLTVRSRSEQVAYALVNPYPESGLLFDNFFDSIQYAYQRHECSTRLKHLTIALLLYEAEHGSMPVGDWREAVKSYLGEVPEGYFGCPSEGIGYALVLTDEKTPETPLLVETKRENISETGTVASDLPPLKVHGALLHTSYRSGVVRSDYAERSEPCCE